MAVAIDPEAFLNEARGIDPKLADWAHSIMEQPLYFRGRYAIEHSARNHVHLWMLEYLADEHKAIDLGFRTRFVEAIFARWTARLPGYVGRRRKTFLMYLYEDMAPTISVVAQTPEGCPYGGELTFVPTPNEVMTEYVGRSWRELFRGQAPLPSPEVVLRAVDKHQGSIGEPTAFSLRMKIGAFRRLIETYDLKDEVNQLRKRYHRRPARFSEEEFRVAFKIYERRVDPRD